jgi:hypothetical protein
MKTFEEFLSSTARMKPVPLQVEQIFMQDNHKLTDVV